jgi:hypothetical protein
LDQLPAEQRAIIELVVQRSRTYDDLADVLGIPSPRVRELAREALVALAPVSARRVDEDRRGQISDYVLGQQSGAEQTATQAHLRRSEAGRAWTSSLVDSLADMYPDGGAPEIPDGEPEPAPRRRERELRGRDRARDDKAAEHDRAPERERPRARGPVREPLRERRPLREPARRPERTREPLRRPAELSPEARAAVRRRRLIGAGAAALAVIAVVLGIVLLSGGSDHKKSPKAAPVRAQARILGELLLRPVRGASGNSQGIAIVAVRGGERDLIVQAKLTPVKQGQAYEVWLYNSRNDALPVGAQVTDQNGNYQGAGKLPGDLSKFKSIDVSLQAIPDQACQRNPACLRRSSLHSGNSVLRGKLSDMRAPSQATPGATGPSGAAGPTGP